MSSLRCSGLAPGALLFILFLCATTIAGAATYPPNATPRPPLVLPSEVPARSSSAPPTPLADPCPLHAAGFSLIGRGSTGHVDRFAVALLLEGTNPVSATLRIPGLEDDVLTPVIGPAGSLSGHVETLVHYVVAVPRSVSTQGISVHQVIVHGAKDVLLTCASPVRIVSQAPGSAQSSFDDGAISGSDLLYLRPVTEAQVLHSAAAPYPADQAQLGHKGVTVIAVTVGAHGAIFGARVLRSSGYPILDDAALAAGRNTVYSEPQFAGAAIPLDYLITYRFGAR